MPCQCKRDSRQQWAPAVQWIKAWAVVAWSVVDLAKVLAWAAVGLEAALAC
jgi:hypothetical protein